MTTDGQKPAKPALSESTVNRLLDAQSRDQELKARELSIRHDELKAQSEFAHKMLSAQVGDRQSERVHISKLLSVKLGAAVQRYWIAESVVSTTWRTAWA